MKFCFLITGGDERPSDLGEAAEADRSWCASSAVILARAHAALD